MSTFKEAFSQFSKNPTSESLGCFAGQIEVISKQLPMEEVKLELMVCMKAILYEEQFSAVRQDETMLRLYKIMGRISTKLGAHGIYQQLDKKGHFSNSIKFFLQWAEELGKDKSLSKFEKVLNLARERLASKMTVSQIESGFRDLADEYFSTEDVQNMFVNPDDTMSLFDVRVVNNAIGKRSKRRSSVVFLRNTAPLNCEKAAFGPKTKTNIRAEFIDTPDCFGISIEEFRYAQFRDDCGEDVEGAEKRRDSGIVTTQHKIDEEDKMAREAVENRMNAKKRNLSAVREDSGEEEKKSRVYSPLVPTKDAHRQPLRNSNVQSHINENIPSTITLSSGTDVSLPSDGVEEDEKLRQMSAAKTRTLSTSSRYSTASTRTAKSASGLDLMVETNCQEAHAMFSDTVHLGNEKTLICADDSDIIVTKDLAPTQPTNVTTDFSVLCDPDPTMTMNDPQPKKSLPGLNLIYDDMIQQQPVEDDFKEKEEDEKPKPKLTPAEKEESILSSLTTPPSYQDIDLLDEEPIRGGFAALTRGNIVTSTPAGSIPFMCVEEYFGNKEEENERQAAEPTFVPPSTSTFQRLMRRKSQAATATAAPPVPVQVPVSVKKPAQPNTSMDCLSDNLGRRLSLGADEIINAIEDAAETTGCKNRRRSEVMKGDVNPWDEDLRKKLMSLVRPPTNMHEFKTRSPKIQAMRDFEAGGEKFRIQTIIGQGGYAKVYRAINDEEKTVAVKYEVPGCAWEVYICDQMRHRLIKENSRDRVRMADWCIMQVIDAYVFSNASLLVNEYHEYGTLLELANNMKDPNWHILCFLVTQMAWILKEVHSCNIIHGDIKPDNFIITRKIDPSWGKESIQNSDAFVIKLIDWGRAIDMLPLVGRTFKGRAGTEGFDSPEMVDGRPWTYQADFFGFAATMTVLATGKYAKLHGDAVGNYSLNVDIKRRNILRETIQSNISTLLNIPSCNQLPDWNATLKSFTDVWNSEFEISAWKQALAKFNEACEHATAPKV
uniref:Protein kinase domain-containing protein n=1 Tax=Caenorhabditis japonica TaxID=281687 RepID=A0A8R1DEZ8_CAEJA